MGPERAVLGSGTPFNTPKIDLEKLLQLDLDEADRRLIFYENIERLISRWIQEYPDYQLK